MQCSTGSGKSPHVPELDSDAYCPKPKLSITFVMDNPNTAMLQFFAALPFDIRCELLLHLPIADCEDLTARHPDFRFDGNHLFWKLYYTRRVNLDYRALTVQRRIDLLDQHDDVFLEHRWVDGFSREDWMVAKLRKFLDGGGRMRDFPYVQLKLDAITALGYYRVLDLILHECAIPVASMMKSRDLAEAKNLVKGVRYWERQIANRGRK